MRQRPEKRKQKTTSRYCAVLWPPCGIVGVLALVYFGIFSSREDESQITDLQANIGQLANTINPRVLKTEQWFTPSFVTLQPAVLSADSGSFLIEQWQNLRTRLNAYPQDKLRELASIFDNSVPQVVAYADDRTFRTASFVEKLSKAELGQRVRVIYFGSEHLKSELLGITEGASYHPLTNVIFIPMWKNPDALTQDAIVFHELEHARQTAAEITSGGAILKSRVGGKLTEVGANHEVEAHNISGDIFDLGTNGEYRRRIRTVMSSKAGVKDAVHLLLALTAADLTWIDESLKPPSQNEYDYRRTQYLLDIGKEWINVHVSEPERLSSSKELYKAFDRSR